MTSTPPAPAALECGHSSHELDHDSPRDIKCRLCWENREVLIQRLIEPFEHALAGAFEDATPPQESAVRDEPRFNNGFKLRGDASSGGGAGERRYVGRPRKAGRRRETTVRAAAAVAATVTTTATAATGLEMSSEPESTEKKKKGLRSGRRKTRSHAGEETQGGVSLNPLPLLPLPPPPPAALPPGVFQETTNITKPLHKPPEAPLKRKEAPPQSLPPPSPPPPPPLSLSDQQPLGITKIILGEEVLCKSPSHEQYPQQYPQQPFQKSPSPTKKPPFHFHSGHQPQPPKPLPYKKPHPPPPKKNQPSIISYLLPKPAPATPTSPLLAPVPSIQPHPRRNSVISIDMDLQPPLPPAQSQTKRKATETVPLALAAGTAVVGARRSGRELAARNLCYREDSDEDME